MIAVIGIKRKDGEQKKILFRSSVTHFLLYTSVNIRKHCAKTEVEDRCGVPCNLKMQEAEAQGRSKYQVILGCSTRPYSQ